MAVTFVECFSLKVTNLCLNIKIMMSSKVLMFFRTNHCLQGSIDHRTKHPESTHVPKIYLPRAHRYAIFEIVPGRARTDTKGKQLNLLGVSWGMKGGKNVPLSGQRADK